jgi:predicted metalloprotease with PDZ domain
LALLQRASPNQIVGRERREPLNFGFRIADLNRAAASTQPFGCYDTLVVIRRLTGTVKAMFYQRAGRNLEKLLLGAVMLFVAVIFHVAVPGQSKFETPSRNELAYVLELTVHGENIRFHVDLYFTGNQKGTSKLRLPLEWDGQEQLYNQIKNLRAESANTRIADASEPQIKYITYAPDQTVHVQYDVIQDWAGSKIQRGLYNRVILQKDYFYFLGNSFWVYPDWEQGESIIAHLQWRNIPNGWKLNNSFGADKLQQMVKTSLENFRKGVFLGGDFRISAIPMNGRPVYVATRGRWKFPDAEFNALLDKVMKIERSFWRDEVFPYYLVILFPTDDAPGVEAGESRTNAILLYFSQDVENTAGMKYTLAHELFHAWNPHKLGELESEKMYWFTEGFTDYYASLLLLRGGLITFEEYIAKYNNLLKLYYSSSVHNLSIVPLLRERRSSEVALRQFYLRGNVLAHNWDALIRSATNGKYSLDDVMRQLLKDARRRGFVLSNRTINDAVRPYLKEGVLEEIKRYIEDGITILPRNDVLGLCFEMYEENIALFDPGFDIDASFAKRVFIGVKEGGNAYRAGLRNGQKWINGGLVNGDPKSIAEFVVEESGVRKAISFYPAGDVKIVLPQFRFKAGRKQRDARDCQSWFDPLPQS